MDPSGLLRSSGFSKVAFAGAVLPPRRFRHRGPPRFLGRTKAQYLDLLMRTNTRLSAFVTFIAVPALMIWSYRYITVLKPAKDAAKQKETEELLAEGRAAA